MMSLCHACCLILLAFHDTTAFVLPHQSFAASRSKEGTPSRTQNDLLFFNPATPYPARPSSHKPLYAFLNFRTSGIELGGLVYDSTDIAKNAWDWTANLGAPAALVAGAVLVTLSETRETSAPRKSDDKRTRFLKLFMRFLLLSSFGLEVVSIFVSTITGSVLLGFGEQKVASKLIGYASPLQLLQYHHEFEYLTTQICFLQGLFNWLAAVAVELKLPKPMETTSARRMNKCLAAWLATLILWMLAFYNHHLSFYADYLSMLQRFFVLFLRRYVLDFGNRPISLLYIPAFFYSAKLTWQAFRSPPELDDE